MKRLIFLVLIVSNSLNAQQLKPLQFRAEIHDFGNVDQEGGAVLHTFEYTNTSTRPIKILNVQASCGCTTPDWTRDAVMPGKTGFIKASFNPKGRPGHFNKSLTITTDFDGNPIVLQVKGNVSTSSGSGTAMSPEFRATMGNWKLKTSSFNMGKVFLKDEFATKEFPVINNGNDAITFSKAETPSYIRAEVVPTTLEPGQQGKVRIGYNGKKKGQYGFQSDNIVLHTDDSEQPQKSFSVYATLEEFFAKLTSDELATAPQLKITDTSFDFGRIRKNHESYHQVSLLNTGKSELEIRAIQGNCSCITATSDKQKIKPGDNTSMKIAFNPQDRVGTQQKLITVYTNDPQNPVQRITFTAYVEN